MWIKLILLLVAFAWTPASFIQKRSSVLTDESKRILDIFDFSNFDKQEALSYIDRQRFENLIRGKRSKWNLFSSNLFPGDYDDNKNQERKWVARCGPKNTYSEGELSANDDKLKSNLLSDTEFDKRRDNEPFLLIPAKNGLRRKRNVKPFENMKAIEDKGSGLNKSGNASGVEHIKFPVNKDEDENVDEGDKDDGYERHRKKRRKRKKRRHWSKWSEWAPCSVTCGKGRKIRFRKCIAKTCASGEIEMGEKICQLPACSLFDKLFSFLM